MNESGRRIFMQDAMAGVAAPRPRRVKSATPTPDAPADEERLVPCEIDSLAGSGAVTGCTADPLRCAQTGRAPMERATFAPISRGVPARSPLSASSTRAARFTSGFTAFPSGKPPA